jgi:hypothetical protein
MARKRMIDPGIWQDEGMAELTPRQQLLYIGMFSNADDEGRLKGSPRAIALSLPTVYFQVQFEDVQADIDAVVSVMGRLVRYQVAGTTYIAFENYRKWQKIDKPSPSLLPPPPETREDSENVRLVIADSAPNESLTIPPKGIEEKGSKKKGTEGKETPPQPPKGGGVPTPLHRSVLSGTQQALFDQFWRAYPRRQAKGEAERWWQRAKPDEATVAEMIGAIGRQLQGGDWQKEGGRFIPLPATWLNQRRWEDETTGPAPKIPWNHPSAAARMKVYD